MKFQPDTFAGSNAILSGPRRANPWPNRLIVAGLIAALVLGASALLAALY